MLNSKLITSKTLLVVMLIALMGQSSAQAVTFTQCTETAQKLAEASVGYAVAGKNLVQKTASDIANSEFVGSATEYVTSAGNAVVEFAAENPLLTAYAVFVGATVTSIAFENYGKYKRDRQRQEECNARCAAEKARKAQEEAEQGIRDAGFIAGKEAQREAFTADKKAQVNALEFEDFVKLVNANVMEAHQLFNEVDGAHILELNNARYNYELSEEEMDALVQELMFACVAQESNAYKLAESERLIQKALDLIDLRSYYKGTIDSEAKGTIYGFMHDVQEVRALINELSAVYQDQATSALNEKVALYQEQQAFELNEKVAEYHAQNPTKQVTLVSHTCGHNCLKALTCDCSGCACTAQIALQS